MEVQGKIIEIFDTQQVTDTFRKREFVLEFGNNPKYPETVLFQFIQDNCSKLDDFKKGDDAKVTFDLKGRRWESPKGEIKYFNSLQAWQIAKVGGASDGPPPAPDYDPAMDIPPQDEGDDLPF